MKKKELSALDELLNEITPQEQAKIDAKMMLAARIDKAMKVKGWKKKDLMQAMGQKHQSVITKWLSGTHNFTMDTLVELEGVLDILLIAKSEKEPHLICLYKIIVDSDKTAKANICEPQKLDESEKDADLINGYSASFCVNAQA